MIYPTLSTLLNKADSKYSIVVAVSKRARQLVDGESSLVEANSNKPVSIAIQEIAQGKIKCVNSKQLKKQSGD